MGASEVKASPPEGVSYRRVENSGRIGLWVMEGLTPQRGEVQVKLAAGLGIAQALEAVAETALERRGRVGIEGDEIPERLGFVFAEIAEGGGVGVGMTSDIFADGAVRMTREAAERLGIGARMFADEA